METQLFAHFYWKLFKDKEVLIHSFTKNYKVFQENPTKKNDGIESDWIHWLKLNDPYTSIVNTVMVSHCNWLKYLERI